MSEKFEDETAYDDTAYGKMLEWMGKIERGESTAVEPKRVIIIGNAGYSHSIAKMLMETSREHFCVVDEISKWPPEVECLDFAEIKEKTMEKKTTNMRLMLASSMAAALTAGQTLSRAVSTGMRRISVESRGSSERISARRRYGQYYTYTKPAGPSRPGQKRLKAKAQGIKTAKARGAYQSAKK